MGFLMGNNPDMDIKDIIAQNLSRLMAQNPALDTFKKVNVRSGVGAETVRRTQGGDGNITVDKLAGIARSFGVSVAYMVTEHDEAPKTAAVVKIQPKSNRQKRLDSIVALLEKIDDTGLAVVLDKCRDTAIEHPIAIKQTPSS